MPEREAKLVIAAPRPEPVADAIAALPRLADRALVPAGEARIHDVYLDTAAGALRAHRHSLRVREEDGRTFLTLKGPGREVEAGVIERDELEAAWSAETYARALDVQAERGIRLTRAPFGHDPLATLLACGLTRIQDRATRRRRLDADGAGAPVAELAVDAVTYRLAAGPLVHHEVEIEAKHAEGNEYLGRALQELRARFGDALMPWWHGKLATGLAMERLLASPDGASLVAGGRLTPAGYARLAALLSGARDAPAD